MLLIPCSLPNILLSRFIFNLQQVGSVTTPSYITTVVNSGSWTTNNVEDELLDFASQHGDDVDSGNRGKPYYTDHRNIGKSPAQAASPSDSNTTHVGDVMFATVRQLVPVERQCH